MLRGYWYLVVINYDISLLRLFDFQVTETCSPILSGFFNVGLHGYVVVHLVGYNVFCVRLTILLSALVLIEPRIKYYVTLFPRNVTPQLVVLVRYSIYRSIEILVNVRYRYFMVSRDSNPIQVSIDIVEIRYRTRTNPHPPTP